MLINIILETIHFFQSCFQAMPDICQKYFFLIGRFEDILRGDVATASCAAVQKCFNLFHRAHHLFLALMLGVMVIS